RPAPRTLRRRGRYRRTTPCFGGRWAASRTRRRSRVGRRRSGRAARAGSPSALAPASPDPPPAELRGYGPTPDLVRGRPQHERVAVHRELALERDTRPVRVDAHLDVVAHLPPAHLVAAAIGDERGREGVRLRGRRGEQRVRRGEWCALRVRYVDGHPPRGGIDEQSVRTLTHGMGRAVRAPALEALEPPGADAGQRPRRRHRLSCRDCATRTPSSLHSSPSTSVKPSFATRDRKTPSVQLRGEAFARGSVARKWTVRSIVGVATGLVARE